MISISLIDVLCPYGCGFAHIPIPSSQAMIDFIGYTWLIMALTFISFLIYILFFRGEEPLEPIFRKWRTRQVEKNLPKKRDNIIDVGSGNLEFLNKVKFRKKIGIERDSPTVYDVDALKGMRKIKSNSITCVTFIASMEHFDRNKLKNLLKEAYRILNFNGRLIITMPTTRSKGILEVLAFFKLISKHLLEEHHYFTKKEILLMLDNAGFSQVKYRLFELGFNSVIVAEKR